MLPGCNVKHRNSRLVVVVGLIKMLKMLSGIDMKGSHDW